MRTLGSMLAETCASWLRSVSSCCGIDEKSRYDTEKPIQVLLDQPVVIPPPSAEPLWTSEQTYEKTFERERGRSFHQRSGSQNSHRSRRRWLSRSSSRRPQISNPSNFRHLQSDSFQYQEPQGQPRPRPISFRPLQLSIYQPDNRLSSLLPYFDPTARDSIIATPPPAHVASSRQYEGSSPTLSNDRSYSSMSFHVPRKHTREGSTVSHSPITPPTIPAKSRARAYTAPSAEPILERIASAMIEKEKLQAEIDSIVERQSLYISSRPSTAYGLQDLEPMPSIPALPAAAPSFAERVSLDDRPRTAPSQATAYTQERTMALAAAAFNSHPPQMAPSYSRVRVGVDRTGSPMTSSTTAQRHEFRDDNAFDRPLAPPLPLVLRPPLRKKKSFSRVSNWLFPAGSSPNLTSGGVGNNGDDPFLQQQRRREEISRDSVTNMPRPVKEGEGFYQCIAPPNATLANSAHTEHLYDGSGFGFSPGFTASSVSSTWETDDDDEEDDDDERRTVPTTTCQSPGSSPVIQNTPKHTPTIQRTATFGSRAGASVASGPAVSVNTTLDGAIKTQIQIQTQPQPQPQPQLAGVGLIIPETTKGPRPQSVGVAF